MALWTESAPSWRAGGTKDKVSLEGPGQLPAWSQLPRQASRDALAASRARSPLLHRGDLAIARLPALHTRKSTGTSVLAAFPATSSLSPQTAETLAASPFQLVGQEGSREGSEDVKPVCSLASFVLIILYEIKRSCIYGVSLLTEGCLPGVCASCVVLVTGLFGAC